MTEMITIACEPGARPATPSTLMIPRVVLLVDSVMLVILALFISTIRLIASTVTIMRQLLFAASSTGLVRSEPGTHGLPKIVIVFDNRDYPQKERIKRLKHAIDEEGVKRPGGTTEPIYRV
jgi:hypothetical protein